MNSNANESNRILKFNYRDLMIFLVPIIIFLLYLFVYNPGVLTVSSYSQLHQIATGKFTTAHPIFHTLIEMLLIKIFGTPFYIGLFQILVFSVLWTAICRYHRDDSAKSSNGFVAQFAITVIFCLIPINAVYSITLSSYVLFAYFIMFLCFLIKVMIDQNGQLDTKIIILMALTIGIMSGLNNYGIAIAIPTLIAIAYYLLKRGASENSFVTLVGLAVLCIFLIASLNFVYDVQSDKLNIPADDKFENNINLESAQNQFFSTINAEPEQEYEKISSVNTKQGSYAIIDPFVELWQQNPILEILFNNPFVYLILSVILLALIYVRTQSNEIFLVYLPPFINTIIAFFTGQPNIYSNMLVFFLIAIICASVYFNPNLMNKVSNRPQTITQPKIQAQPQAEFVENQVNENYYTDLESKLEELTLDDINKMLNETPGKGTQKQKSKQTKQQKPKQKETKQKETKKQTKQQKPKQEKPQKPKETPKQKPKQEKPQKPKETIEQEQTIPEGDSDLIDQILKEMGKK
ncbi:hypothetical protein [Methanobrevibacter sp.]|uniref:hypothetical protein n=1 Tax=Methanobrevibacter sp. TaxID=66852 RepID=UPI0038663DD1